MPGFVGILGASGVHPGSRTPVPGFDGLLALQGVTLAQRGGGGFPSILAASGLWIDSAVPVAPPTGPVFLETPFGLALEDTGVFPIAESGQGISLVARDLSATKTATEGGGYVDSADSADVDIKGEDV